MKIITASEMVAEGYIVLMRGGKPAWNGRLSAPWDDVECDTMIVNPLDFERWLERLREPAPPPDQSHERTAAR
jgi:hypothetical protein